MNTNKILLAALAGGVLYFLLGWLCYGALFTSLIQSSEITAEQAAAVARPYVMWAMIASCLVYGGVFALVFGRWAGITTFATGAKAGAVLGGMITLAYTLSQYSMFKTMTLNTAFIMPVIEAVLGALVGGLVGWVLGYGNKR